MNLAQYRKLKEERLHSQTKFRERCPECLKSLATCFCAYIKAFSPSTKFIILIHRDEAKRSIATGRMAHLCLSNSSLIQGYEFSESEKVNEILRDPKNFPVILYPGKNAVDLSAMPAGERKTLFPNDKQLVVFVLDATWAQAKRMKRFSRNLDALPLICFTPSKPSTFRVRKQPKPNCYSTIEAIHELIDLLGPEPHLPHRNMLEVFDAMVEQQLKYQSTFSVGRVTRETRRRPVTLPAPAL